MRFALIAPIAAALIGVPSLLSHQATTQPDAVPAARPFAAASFWNRPLATNAPLDPASGMLVRALVAQQRGYGDWINTTSYSTPVYRVPAGQPTVRVTIDHPPSTNLTALQRQFNQVPVPRGARPAAGRDGRMTIWQPSTDTMWELWRVRRSVTGAWHAGWGAMIPGVSSASGVNPFPFGATASGLALAGGLITLDDVRRGEIDHVLALGVPRTRRRQFTAPANRTDGHATGPNSIPEGTRYRLDPSVRVSSLPMSGLGRMIALAAQRYGIVVRDGSALVTFYGEDPTPTGSNPWPGWFGNRSPARTLDGFPWSRLQAVAPTHG